MLSTVGHWSSKNVILWGYFFWGGVDVSYGHNDLGKQPTSCRSAQASPGPICQPAGQSLLVTQKFEHDLRKKLHSGSVVLFCRLKGKRGLSYGGNHLCRSYHMRQRISYEHVKLREQKQGRFPGVQCGRGCLCQMKCSVCERVSLCLLCKDPVTYVQCFANKNGLQIINNKRYFTFSYYKIYYGVESYIF